jgi:hypothetical protein
MTRKILLICLSIFLICFVICFIIKGAVSNTADNYYNYFTGFIYCQTKETCLHEVAHKYDDESKMISESVKWIQAVDDYRMTQFYMPQEHKVKQAFGIMFFPGVGSPRLPEHNIFAITFWQGGWGGYTELYATIVQFSGGDVNKIPLILRDYYDMEKINETMKGLGY